MEQYKLDLQKVYEANPEVKKQEDEQKKIAKEKRVMLSQLDKSQARHLEYIELVMFTVGHLLKFGEPLKSTPKIKQIIKTGFEKLSEEDVSKLRKGWNDLTVS